MAQEQDFQLISVTPDDEDDIVIQAGVVSDTADGVSSGVVSDAAVSDAGVGDAPAEETPEPVQGRPHTNDMLTTEEDLHAPVPFAGMQRAIMVAFLLLIAAAVVYWFFIRPMA